MSAVDKNHNSHDVLEVFSLYATVIDGRGPCLVCSAPGACAVTSTRWTCSACGAAGDGIDLVMMKESIPADQAMEKISRATGAVISNAASKAEMKAALAWAAEWFASQFGGAAPVYMTGRGFTADTLATFQVGWAPGYGAMTSAALNAGHTVSALIAADLSVERDGKATDRFFARIMLPIHDRSGHVVGFQGRALPEDIAAAKAADRVCPKYTNTRETDLFHKGRVLFNARALRDADRAVIVEGPLDAMAAHQAGVPGVVATMGTALTSDHLPLVNDLPIVLAFDADKAGRDAAMKALTTTWKGGLTTSVVILGEGKDLCDVQQTGQAVDIPNILAQSIRDIEALFAFHCAELPADQLDRLPLLDWLVEQIAVIPDQLRAGLYCDRIAEHLGFAKAEARKLLKSKAAATGSPAAVTKASARSVKSAGPTTINGHGEYAAMVNRWVSWLRERGLRPDALSGWLESSGASADVTTGEMQTDFTHEVLLSAGKIRREECQTAVEATVRQWRMERRAEILRDIIGKPASAAGRAELEKLLTAWTGAADALHVAVLGHWLWQVKRRAAGMPVDWDLMPVLVGRQGSGKTSEVKRLCDALCELAVPVTATQIVDAREAPLLARALAALWDEMSGASRTDSDALKRAVSMSQAACRRLYSQDFEVRRRTITFLGTSNLPLHVILRDTTGARRFAEIPVHQVNFTLSDQVDYKLVWDAVSETDQAPIIPMLAELRQHQSLLVFRDLLHHWFEHEADNGFGRLEILRPNTEPDIIPPLAGWKATSPNERDASGKDPGGWTTDQIAKRVHHFGASFGRGMVAIENLGQRLTELGFESRQVRVGDRADNRRPRRWFLSDAVRARLFADDISPTTTTIQGHTDDPAAPF